MVKALKLNRRSGYKKNQIKRRTDERFNDSNTLACRNVSVACGKHGGETGDLFLPAADGRGFLELPTHTDDFERAFAVDFFLKPAQRTFHRFAFFQFNL